MASDVIENGPIDLGDVSEVDHTGARLIDLDGAGGNQDRSLSAEAVIFPGSLSAHTRPR